MTVDDKIVVAAIGATLNAFGAPGDYGYDTAKGAALYGLCRLHNHLVAGDVVLGVGRVTLSGIVAAVADAGAMDVRLLTGPARDGVVVWHRDLAVALARKLTVPQMSISEIGRRLGGRDHSTISAALARIQGQRIHDEEWVEAYSAVAQSLRAAAAQTAHHLARVAG